MEEMINEWEYQLLYFVYEQCDQIGQFIGLWATF